MTTGFELATPARVVFGAGRAKDVPAEVAALGVRRVLLVTGRTAARAAPIAAGLAGRGIAAVPLGVDGEPTVELVREGTALGAREGCDGVLAVGGGSAIDAGKAIAGLLGNGSHDPLEHLEVVGRGKPLARPGLPFVAVPTTAGTGSEVTRNAVLSAGERRGGRTSQPGSERGAWGGRPLGPSGKIATKASLRSPHLLARLAVVDPDLLEGVPREVLVASGLDALAQLVEPFLSARANPVTDALAVEGMRRSARALRPACLDGLTAARREDLALASLLGGLCLANSGLGAVHGFAAPAGAALGAPHGALCAALLAPCLAVNLRALRARAPVSAAEARFGELARQLTGRADASPEGGIAWVEELCHDLGVRGLAAHGLAEGEIADLVAGARAASSMKANPIALTDGELEEIVRRAM